jgi:tetratricopeptide (TPR) repeat protein
LVALVAGMLCAVVADHSPADGESALELLRQGEAQARAGDIDQAIDLARAALRGDPRLTAAHRLLGDALARKGLTTEAIDAYAQALTLSPQDSGVRDAVRGLLAGDYPETMAKDTPMALAVADLVSFGRVEIALSDERLEPERRGSRPAMATLEPLPVRGRDGGDGLPVPRIGGRANRALYGYLWDADSGRYRRRVSVYWASVAPIGFPDAAALTARRALDLLVKLYAVREGYLGPTRPVVRLWLQDGGPAGAESWGADLYVYRAWSARGDAEWLRQIAHEFGHVTLPGVDHFQRPEAWANGHLGERLFIDWLSRNRALLSGDSPWTAGLSADDLLQRRIGPLVDLFLREGPSSALARDPDEQGMNYYLGAVLYLDRAFGSALVTAAMKKTYGVTTEDFLAGAANVIGERATTAGLTLSAPMMAGMGERAFWVFLDPGKWTVEGPGGDPAPAVEVDGMARRGSFPTTRPGWHRMVLGADLVEVRLRLAP